MDGGESAQTLLLTKRTCQNSPFNEIIPATTICSEDDFLFIRVLTHPLLIYC